MIKKMEKRCLSLLLAVMMLLCALPLGTIAASASERELWLNDEIGLSTDGSVMPIVDVPGTMGQSSETYDMFAVHTTYEMGGTANAIELYTAWSGTVTLTNNTENSALLFRYAVDLDGGTLSYTTNGAVRVEGPTVILDESNASITFELTSSTTSPGTTILTLYDYGYFNDTTYAVSVSSDITVESGDPSAVSCTSPLTLSVNNSAFYAYVDEEGTVLSTSSTFTLYPTSDMSVRAIYATDDDDTPVFGYANKAFDDLNTAIASIAPLGMLALQFNALYPGQDLSINLVLLRSGTLKADQYTIPAGVTLLVPFEETNISLTSHAYAAFEYVDAASAMANFAGLMPREYRKLTVPSGAEITVNGAVSVGARSAYASGSLIDNTGVPMTIIGGYGWIDMQPDSTMLLKSGSSLYAWGFVTGDGTVEAMEGSNIYELMQVEDFPGVNGIMAYLRGGLFPFNQYYIQNVEATLVIHRGAIEYVTVGLSASSSLNVAVSAPFFGEGGIFELNNDNSILVKKYDTDEQKLKIELEKEDPDGEDADFTLGTLSINVIPSLPISSADYVLPINNMDVTVAQDSTLTTSHMVNMLPGSAMVIEDGAKLNLISEVVDGKSYTAQAYFTDTADWTSNVNPVSYSPTTPGAITTALYQMTNGAMGEVTTRLMTEPEPASLAVNGTVQVSADAVICSSPSSGPVKAGDNAQFIFDGAAANSSYTIGVIEDGEDTQVTYNSILLANDPAVDGFSNPYTNVSGEYTDTQNRSSDGATYQYDAESGIWYRGVLAKIYDPDTGELIGFVMTNGDLSNPVVYEAYVDTTVIDDGLYMEDFQATGISADGAILFNYVPVEKFNITWYNYVGDVMATAKVPEGTQPQLSIDFIDANLYFDNLFGWMTEPEGDIEYSIDDFEFDDAEEYVLFPAADQDISYYPYGEFTVTWKNGSTVLATDYDVPGGTMPEYNGDTPTMASNARYTYTFSGWSPAVHAVDGDVTYTARFSSSPRNYTITWQLPGGLGTTTSSVPYGTVPVYTGETTLTEGDLTYTITGWSPALTAVTGEATYTAEYSVSGSFFTKQSLVLDGKIGVNFYFDIPSGYDIDDFSVDFDYYTETETNTTIRNNSDGYYATCYVDLPELTDAITARLYHRGNPADTATYKGAEYAKKQLPAADNKQLTDGYYLVGTIMGNDYWAANIQPRYKMHLNPANSNEYMITDVELKVGDQFKVVHYENGEVTYWYNDQTSGNNVEIKDEAVAGTGTYTVYCKINQGANTVNFSKQTGRDNTLVSLIRALLNVGARSQTYFKHNLSDLADQPSYLTSAGTFGAVTDDMITAKLGTAAPTIDRDMYAAAGLQYVGSSLTLNADTVLRHYYQVTDADKLAANMDKFWIGADGETYTNVAPTYVAKNMVCFEVSGIEAANLDKKFVLSANLGSGDLRMEYSALDYVRLTLKSSDANLKALGTALYWYNYYADIHFA